MTETREAADSGFRALLSNKDFSKLWFGQLVSNAGYAISYLALLFFAYALTGSPLAMAILAIVQTVPVLAFSGFIGVFVDRWDRKKIMIASDLSRMVFIVLIPLSIYLPRIIDTIYYVYIFTFLYSVSNAWFYPARNASIPRIVEEEQLVSANSLSQMTFQVVQLAIPPIGGVLVALLAPDYFLAFALNACTFMISAVSLYGIKTSLVPQTTTKQDVPLIHQMADGARTVLTNSVLSYFFVLAMLLAFSSGILNALIIPHLEGDLGISEAQTGIIFGAGAAVGTLVAFVLGRQSELKHPLYLSTLSGLVAGISVIGFAYSTTFMSVLLSWALIGAVDVMINIPIMTLMQEIVKDEMRGRVFSLLSIVFTSVQVIGMGSGGIWAELVGSSIEPLAYAGLLFVVCTIIGLLTIRRLDLNGHLYIMLKTPEKTEEVARDTKESSESPAISVS